MEWSKGGNNEESRRKNVRRAKTKKGFLRRLLSSALFPAVHSANGQYSSSVKSTAKA